MRIEMTKSVFLTFVAVVAFVIGLKFGLAAATPSPSPSPSPEPKPVETVCLRSPNGELECLATEETE